MASPDNRKELLCGTMSSRLQRLREEEAEELLAKLGLADSTIDSAFRLMIKGMKPYPHTMETPRPFRINVQEANDPTPNR